MGLPIRKELIVENIAAELRVYRDMNEPAPDSEKSPVQRGWGRQ
jgi:hypothetical protein